MKGSATNQSALWVIPLILFGFFIFVYQLDRVPLWSDEGWTIAATNADVSLVETVTDWIAIDVHPPLYFLQLNLWRDFTGDSVFAMRYLAVLVAVIGVALAYRLGRDLYSHRAGMIAALLFGLHDFVRVLAQEVRHYPQPMALVLLCAWLYWRLWQKPTARRIIPLAIAGAALLYTHYWGGFVLLGLFVHALLTKRQQFRLFFLSFAGMGALFIPWLPFLYDQITLERPGGLPHALENSQTVYAVLTYQLLGIPEMFWVMLFVVGGLNIMTRKRPTAASSLPLVVVGLAVGLTLVLNAFYPTLSFRSMAVIVPLLVVGAAYALSEFGQRERAILLVFVAAYGLTTTSAGPQLRGPWLQMADYVLPRSTPDDAVMIEIKFEAVTYYLDQSVAPPDYLLTKPARLRNYAGYSELLDTISSNYDGLWIANVGWVEYDVRADLAARGFVESAPEFDMGRFAGEPAMIWRMDRIPDGEPVAIFGDGREGDALRLLRGNATVRENNVDVTLLWSAPATPEREYTISAFLLGTDGAFANQDGPPLDGRAPTITWSPDAPVFDAHRIDASALPPGEYRVGVQVYYFTDQTFTEIANLTLDTCDDDPDCRFIVVDTVTVE